MSKATKGPIVIVKTGEPVPSVLATRGHFHDMIERAIGDEWTHGYRVVDAQRGEALDASGAAAIVITGSSANVPNREPWMLRCEAWLRDVVPTGVPVMGLCFGHQILAQALGGEVIKNPRGREIGTCRIDKSVDDPLFDGLPASFEANVTHVDTVARLPDGAVALARTDKEPHHAIRFTKTCYGVQFHPEIDGEIMRGYIETRREILQGEGFDVDAMLAAITDATLGRETLKNFIRHVVR